MLLASKALALCEYKKPIAAGFGKAGAMRIVFNVSFVRVCTPARLLRLYARLCAAGRCQANTQDNRGGVSCSPARVALYALPEYRS